MPDVIWSTRQRALMDVMPGERVAPRAFRLPGSRVPRRLQSGIPDRVEPLCSANPLAFLVAPGSVDAASDDLSAIEIFHAGGREAEIDEVFRRILRSGAPVDQVEIACASDAHAFLIWEKALRHEWPVTLASGIPAAATRPGRALLGLCDWIETDFSASHLRHLLQSGDFGLELDDEGFTSGQAARTLARAEAGWGRATYGLALGALRHSYESRAKDPNRSDDEREDAGEKAVTTAAVAAWIETLIAAVPKPSAEGLVPLESIVSLALAFLDRSTSRSSQLDHRAAAALIESVGELRSLGSFSCSLR